ncbi:MAG: 16S rRNA (uracil(1498)-N(3))-methyltransferase [Pirellulales bacterium]
MTDRYFVESPIQGESARLVAGEAHHLLHVMRATPGDLLTLFDDSGAEFTARVERVGRADVELAVISRLVVDRELKFALTLGVALPKGDRQRYLVEKATELGVARLVPLESEHAIDRATPSTLEKLRRAVIEASKQCGRNRLMEISAPQSLDEFLAAATTGGVRLIAHPGGRGCADALAALLPPESAPPVALAIGPEGGFTQAEVALAESCGWQTVDLGPRVLRVETAAVALVSVLVQRLGGTDDECATGGE